MHLTINRVSLPTVFRSTSDFSSASRSVLIGLMPNSHALPAASGGTVSLPVTVFHTDTSSTSLVAFHVVNGDNVIFGLKLIRRL